MTLRLVRASDWPPSQHLAADAYEASTIALATTQGDAYVHAVDAYQLACRRFGTACLSLDKTHRPHVYR